MGQSYRIKTELGINKSINVQLDQQFEFLEVLSLTLQQEDIYTKSCAQYGVIVGRVTANNGFGLPNARVSVFIPITSIDESNPIISSIYPYKSPNDKNEDGYRYNLLPYEKSYSSHSATGTLPSRLDSLTGETAVEIYDKYYKYSVKTNDSGDYMIMGVPQGNHRLVMDVDLSDIGEFSLTPQDLIRMGLATDAQVAGNRFRTSTDLNSLPQIINIVRDVEVSPLWGDPELCDIAINRLDFDLRDDANIDIQPTAVFMGSIYSTSDNYRIRPNARPADDMGNLCSLVAGPGQILSIRQTIYQDIDGNPVLEQHQLEQSGNIIDGNGVWITELPMNLDYFITNEFGEKVLSNDPTIGIPTKSKYRFKIKWQQSANLTEQVRRPYYLVPNVKEYGWGSNINVDPNNNPSNNLQLQSSYYFGLAWSGYTNGFTGNNYFNRLNEIINCEDTFYEFQFNKVYTVSGLIDQFKNGGRGQFIGIKEIDSQDCETTINKFPVNEGFRNFDLLYFIFAIILQIIQLIGPILLTIYHLLAFLWNNLAPILIPYLAFLFGKIGLKTGIDGGKTMAAAFTWPPNPSLFASGLVKIAIGVIFLAAAAYMLLNFKELIQKKFPRLKLPMMTYPDCEACDCSPENLSNADTPGESAPPQGLLTQLSDYNQYLNNLQDIFYDPTIDNEERSGQDALLYSQGTFGGIQQSRGVNVLTYKNNISQVVQTSGTDKFIAYGVTLPPGERINIYNTRKKYFDDTPTATTGGPTPGVNRISVTFNYPSNINKFHYDNTLTVLSPNKLNVGDMITFVNPGLTTDVNYLFSGTSNGYSFNGVNGIIKNNPFNGTVKYAETQLTEKTTNYSLPGIDSTCFLSLTISAITSGTTTYNRCIGGRVTENLLENEVKVIFNENGIDIDTLGGTAEIKILNSGETCSRYTYPMDIEYYQVLTAITITKTVVNGKNIYTIPNLGSEKYGFWDELNNVNGGYYLKEESGGWVFPNGVVPPVTNAQGTIYPNPNKLDFTYETNLFENFENQVILILQRGVDPFSPLMPNSYGIGKILGHAKENAVVISGLTRMNIPIQKLPSNTTITVQDHKKANEIFSPSQYFTPGIPTITTPGFSFSSYTTSNVGYYGALDSKFNFPPYKVTSKNKQDYYINGNVNFRGYNNRYGVFPVNIAGTALGVSVNSLSSNNLFGSPTTLPAGLTNYSIGGLGWSFLNSLPPSVRYSTTEDLSGAAYMYKGPWVSRQTFPNPPTYRLYYETTSPNNLSPFSLYFSPLLLPQFTGTTSKLTVSSGQVVMRSDRLPSSDTFDVTGVNDEDLSFLNSSVALLQQNLSFAAYAPQGGSLTSLPSFSTGAQQVTANIEGQLAQENVLKTMSSCEKMVGLNCYSGNGTNFGVQLNCQNADAVESGCYIMVNRPLLDLPQDLITFGEWGYRFRFYYGLCRGVLSQSFTNNWVNGSLYMFPLQVDTKFNLFGVASSVFARPLVYFDNKTNTFYYRSSPYQVSSNNFIGRGTNDLEQSINKRNLLFPTTIVNLGMKDDIYQEILFEPSSKGYIMKSLNPSSYSDTSDLVNLFVISRITSAGWIKQIISQLNNSLNILFSRNGNSFRVDGDLAQAMSINSEFGVIPFSPQFYNVNGTSSDPVVILGPPNTPSDEQPTMGIFFSSSTFDLQNKDFLSPGIIDFRFSNNANAVTYEYGIKSQRVPFYPWDLNGGTTIFGTEQNNWKISEGNNGIFSEKYQSLSRRTVNAPPSNPSYFMASSAEPPGGIGDIYQRGYLYNVGNNGQYSLGPIPSSVTGGFLIGAPNHFYFGIIQGETALDKFKTKYSLDE